MSLRRSLPILMVLLPLLVTVHASFAAQNVEAPARARLETILFMGSSTIYNWQRTMAGQFPEFRTVTECEGGSDFPWLISVVRQAVRRHNPDRIVIYSGDNDLSDHSPPQMVARNFERTVELIRDQQSETPIYVISIKPAPGRRQLLPQVRETNSLLKTAAARLHKVYYVDIFSSMLGENGEIAEQNFDPNDSMHIHLSPVGYELWTSILSNHLKLH